MSEEPRLRASDPEREQTAAAIREAMGEGRLTLAEGEQRLTEAYGVTYRDELPRLTADLPPAATTEPRRRGESAVWRRSPREYAVALALVLAVVLAVGAVLTDAPFWPAIVFGIVTLKLGGKTHRARSG